MTVRKILGDRAEPKAEAFMDALVQAAVFIGDADGRFGEDELNVFIDGMREVVSSAVGPDLLKELGSTPKLLDRARAARRQLKTRGPEAFLAVLGPRFAEGFHRHGLMLAYRVATADGKVSPQEAAAFKALAKALGIEAQETQVLEELAAYSEAASQSGHQGAAIELLQALQDTGWKQHTGAHFDAGMSFTQGNGEQLCLELDSGESVIHVYLPSADAQEVHLLCFFGAQLGALLTALNAMKATLTAMSLQENAAALKAACLGIFVERQGRFSKL